MDDEFELPAEYKGHRYLFKASLLVFGFTHKFKVDVNAQIILVPAFYIHPGKKAQLKAADDDM